MSKSISFYNLTNGVEYLSKTGVSFDKARFIRIQSTACEQKRWNQIILDLSDDFLIHFVCGSQIKVFDCGANKNTPRAIWQGLEWIKFCLFRRVFEFEYMPEGRAKEGIKYFEHFYNHELDKNTKKRIDFFKKFRGDQLPKVTSVTQSTKKDGDYQFHKERVLKLLCGEE